MTLSKKDVEIREVGEMFAKDKKTVYRITKLLSDEQYDKMDVAQTYAYHKDIEILLDKISKKITLNGRLVLITPLKNSDPNTFQYFSLRGAKDKNQVYHYTKPTEKIDADSFEHLITIDPIFNDLAKDKNFVYNINVLRKVRNADAKSFKILNRFWAADKNHVYCLVNQKWQRQIDVNSFSVKSQSTHDARDKDYHYSIEEGIDGFTNTKVKKKKK